MEITKKTVIDRMEILENGTIQVREARRVFEGSELLAEKYHRYVLTPDMDVSTQPSDVKKLCTLRWTKKVKDAYAVAAEKAAK